LGAWSGVARGMRQRPQEALAAPRARAGVALLSTMARAVAGADYARDGAAPPPPKAFAAQSPARLLARAADAPPASRHRPEGHAWPCLFFCSRRVAAQGRGPLCGPPASSACGPGCPAPAPNTGGKRGQSDHARAPPLADLPLLHAWPEAACVTAHAERRRAVHSSASCTGTAACSVLHALTASGPSARAREPALAGQVLAARLGFGRAPAPGAPGGGGPARPWPDRAGGQARDAGACTSSREAHTAGPEGGSCNVASTGDGSGAARTQGGAQRGGAAAAAGGAPAGAGARAGAGEAGPAADGREELTLADTARLPPSVLLSSCADVTVPWCAPRLQRAPWCGTRGQTPPARAPQKPAPCLPVCDSAREQRAGCGAGRAPCRATRCCTRRVPPRPRACAPWEPAVRSRRPRGRHESAEMYWRLVDCGVPAAHLVYPRLGHAAYVTAWRPKPAAHAAGGARSPAPSPMPAACGGAAAAALGGHQGPGGCGDGGGAAAAALDAPRARGGAAPISGAGSAVLGGDAGSLAGAMAAGVMLAGSQGCGGGAGRRAEAAPERDAGRAACAEPGRADADLPDFARDLVAVITGRVRAA
jgi:hypothetical protein